MHVRPARVEDAAAIAAVHVQTWQAAYAHVFGEERLAGLELGPRVDAWRRGLEEQPAGGQVLVADADGRVVAFASVGTSRDARGEGELYAIYALPDAWGQGAAPALMASALDVLRAAGFPTATLWVLEDNPRARRFYEREGWYLDGMRRRGVHLGVEVAELRYRILL